MLKQLRLSEKMTQPELASKIGVSRSAISMYENGAREPDISTLLLISDFFGVTVDYLLGCEKKPTAKGDGLTETERRFLSLSPEKQQTLLNFIEALTN